MQETAQAEEEQELEETQVEEAEEREEDPETIALAKSMGWVEEDRYRGNKDNWVDAKKFVDKGMNDLPVLRERVRAQAKKLGDMEADIQAFKTHHEDSLKREYQRAMQEVQEKQRSTVEEGNTEEFDRLEQEKARIAREHAASVQKTSRPENQLYTEWKQKNADWFEKDDEMTSYANTVSDWVAERHPDLIGKQGFLDKVEEEVKIRYRDKFENPAREGAPSVEGGGRQRRTQSGGKTYSDLPAAAKAACDRFVRRGLITRDQYVKDYEWE